MIATSFGRPDPDEGGNGASILNLIFQVHTKDSSLAVFHHKLVETVYGLGLAHRRALAALAFPGSGRMHARFVIPAPRGQRSAAADTC